MAFISFYNLRCTLYRGFVIRLGFSHNSSDLDDLPLQLTLILFYLTIICVLYANPEYITVQGLRINKETT